jgi:iron complex outermembrane recepter protein
MQEKIMKLLKNITSFLGLAGFWLCATAFGIQSPDSTTYSGLVIDAVSGEPVPGVHLYIESAANGTVSDTQGRFTIDVPGSEEILIISHVAYRQIRMIFSEIEMEREPIIRLNPIRLDSDELIVSAGRFEQAWSGIYNTAKTRPVEDHMSAISGLDMVTRANFAKDPVIRGLRDGRVNVLVDGMRMTPACVDGMDPITAYVESDNLQAIEISRGQEAQPLASTAPGGSVNFAMARPVLNSGFTGSAETGYHTASSQHFLQSGLSYGGEQWAVRLSGTYRIAGDLIDGHNTRIHGSGLEKGNLFSSIVFNRIISMSFPFGISVIMPEKSAIRD